MARTGQENTIELTLHWVKGKVARVDSGIDASGSWQSLKLDSIPFRVRATADPTEDLNNSMNSTIRTTGASMLKKLLKNRSVSGVTVVANASELAILDGLEDRLEPFSISYIDASGSKVSFVGTISTGGEEAA